MALRYLAPLLTPGVADLFRKGGRFRPEWSPVCSGTPADLLWNTHTISDAIEIIRDNIGRIVEEYTKGEDRKHLVLKP